MTGPLFGYDSDRLDGDRTLHGIDLVVPARPTIAIVGETGTGKTSLACLLVRLPHVDEGAVLLEGHHIGELAIGSADGMPDALGLVAQDTYLFHDMPAANLRSAAPDTIDADLDAALRAARLDGVVASLQQGYDIVVGARGCRFTRGEGLVTRCAVKAAGDELAHGRTRAAIACRPSTVWAAGRVLVLERRIVERAAHPNPLARGGRHARLAGVLTG